MNGKRFSPVNTIIVILISLAVLKLAQFLGADEITTWVLAFLVGWATGKPFPLFIRE